MTYKQYDDYKTSEVKWFDKIPSKWDIRPIKHLANTIPGGTPSTSNLEYWENGNIPWLPSGMVQNCIIKEENAYKFITEKGLLNSATKYIGPNSILIALTGATCANIGFLTFKATANQSVISIEPYNFNSKYIYYALISQREQILDKKTGGAQSGINEEDVKNIMIPAMSISEQIQIANYLDKKTSKIDTTIAKNKELINLLEEKRDALINQVVTKGLNPEVPMKDSGIEWIGEIPEHWNIRKMKHLGTARNGLTYKPEDIAEEGTLVLRSSNIQDGKLVFLDNVYIKSNINSKLLVNENDLLICSRNGSKQLIGKSALITKEISGNTFGAFMMLFKSKHNKFIQYTFKSKIFAYYIDSFLTSTINQLTLQNFNNMSIPIVLDLDEQNQIVNYLEKETSKLNKTIAKIKENINLLEEYKTSLIYHVVTGKIDVGGEEI